MLLKYFLNYSKIILFLLNIYVIGCLRLDLIYTEILLYIVEIVVFLVLTFVLGFVLKKIYESEYKVFDLKEYFPEEEIHSLKQIFFLIMMGLIFIDILYVVVFISSDLFYFVVFDIVLSLYLAIKLDTSSLKNKIILILLIPYGSLTFLLFSSTLVGIMDLIHVPVLIYFIKVYHDKFREYTASNGLGIAILLLFTIIFISFFVTQFSEGVSPLNSIVMVSNAFTSNGYAVLGKSIVGKIDAILLVWGGYLLSGVGTATLTSAILINHYNGKIEEVNEKLDKLENLINEK